MYSNQMRFTGLSGIDTDSMVQQLMKAESVRYDKLKVSNQLLLWQQEAYRKQTSTIKGFQTGVLDMTKTANNIRIVGNFKSMSTSILDKATGKESTAISVRASSSAAAGTYKLKVTDVATKDLYNSASSASSTIKASDASEQVFMSSDKFEFTIDGTKKTLSFTDAEINDIAAISDVELRANKIATVLQGKINDAFGVDTALGNANKIDVGVSGTAAGAKLTFSGNNGHNVTLSGSSVSKLGFRDSDAKSTVFSESKTLEQVFGGTAGILDSTGKASFNINGIDFQFDKSDSFEKVFKAVNNSEAGVNLSFSTLNGKFKLESKKEGVANKIDFKDITGTLFEKGFEFGKAGTVDPNHIAATDSVFEFNGNKTTRSSNSFELDGISISITGIAKGQEYEINVKKDSAKTFDVIKNFVDEYNTLLETLNKEMTDKRPKNGKYTYYEPLSDEQRKAMSDKDIELWEGKAKTGLLNRDPILRKITQDMRNMLYQKVELPDGSKIALYDIGITTTNKTDAFGKLEIDEDKLKKALDERGDDVMVLFTKDSKIPYTDKANSAKRMAEQGLGARLNDIVENTVGLNGSIAKKAGIVGSPSMVDNELYNRISDMDNRISSMLDYLQQKETSYFSMFAKMEAAMTQSNSQMAALQSMLGVG